MSTYNAIYVRKQGTDDDTCAGILGLYPRARIETLPSFCGGILSDNDLEPPEEALVDLSAKLNTDVIWITFQTTAESFIFDHWRAGVNLRALWYGCASEGKWDRAEGDAEPWEAEAFWSEDALESALECAESASERKRLERIWKERIIRKGEAEPTVSSEDAAHAAMEHYGLFSSESPTLGTVARQQEAGASRRRRWGCVLIILVWVAFAIATVIRIVERFK